jgi:hypothetical protein
MSACGMVDPSFLMKRKPCVQAASRTSWATEREGLDISITGISDSAMVRRCLDCVSLVCQDVDVYGGGERLILSLILEVSSADETNTLMTLIIDALSCIHSIGFS